MSIDECILMLSRLSQTSSLMDVFEICCLCGLKVLLTSQKCNVHAVRDHYVQVLENKNVLEKMLFVSQKCGVHSCKLKALMY